MARTDGSAEVEQTASCQPDGARLGHDAGDARTRRQLAGPDHLDIQLGLALVPLRHFCRLALRIGRQTGLGHERGREQRGHALLATADAEGRPVLLLGPLHGQAELTEGLIERRQVPVSFGVSEDAVAVEDECGHALPSAPKRRMWVRAMSITASRTKLKSAGGSAASGCSVR